MKCNTNTKSVIAPASLVDVIELTDVDLAQVQGGRDRDHDWEHHDWDDHDHDWHHHDWDHDRHHHDWDHDWHHHWHHHDWDHQDGDHNWDEHALIKVGR